MASTSEFIENHEMSLAKSLGIEIVESDRQRVAARVVLDFRHINELGAVQGGVIMMAADIVGALGAVLNIPEGFSTATLESKTNFFGKGSGNLLWAEAQPVHIGKTTSVWRTTIWRGDDLGSRLRISEVTQTQIHLEDRRSEKSAAIAVAAAAPSPKTEAAKEADASNQVVQIADIRRREILKGASEVILKKGFAAASVREIAEAASMPIPTMYKYIDSKEHILELMYETFTNDFREEFNRAMRNSPPSQEKVLHALKATIQTFDRHHRELKLLFTESKSLSQDALRRLYAQDRRYLDLWKNVVIDDGVDRRLNVDAELIATFLYYLTTVWPIRHWSIGRWSVEEVTDAMVTFVAAALRGSSQQSAT
jgi:uncharacterized protein (TIGR00369 family)